MMPGGELQFIFVVAGEPMKSPFKLTEYDAEYLLHPAEPETMPDPSKKAVISVSGSTFNDPEVPELKVTRYQVTPARLCCGPIPTVGDVSTVVEAGVCGVVSCVWGLSDCCVHPERQSIRIRDPARRPRRTGFIMNYFLL